MISWAGIDLNSKPQIIQKSIDNRQLIRQDIGSGGMAHGKTHGLTGGRGSSPENGDEV